MVTLTVRSLKCLAAYESRHHCFLVILLVRVGFADRPLDFGWAGCTLRKQGVPVLEYPRRALDGHPFPPERLKTDLR
jgi:hypothetical protein